jgi:hypothetical protein
MRRIVVSLLLTVSSCLVAIFTVGAAPAQAITYCQRELPYSISVVRPDVTRFANGGLWVIGRVNVWDNDMDGCFMKVCLQRRVNGVWGAQLGCIRWEMGYANFHYHWSKQFASDCDELNDNGDDFRSTFKLDESSSYLVGPVRDVC